jgi:thiol:disulfide interchange protein DsbG
MILWSAQNQYVFSGGVFDAAGNNLTESAAVQAGLIPPPVPAAQALSLTQHSAKGISLGKSGPEVIAFEDPNCSACHAMGQQVKGLLDAGKLRLKVIPVAIVKPDSAARAAAILAAKDPAAAWQRNEATFNVSAEEGGYPVMKTMPDKALSDVQENTQLLFLLSQNQPATPTILYCDKHGAPHMSKGWVPGIADDLADCGKPEAKTP